MTEIKPKSISSVMDEANNGGRARHTYPTGFSPLDRVIGGGIRSNNLTLMVGAPGAGKTITTLQWARNMARDGRHVIFACYEHTEATLLTRLLHLELGELSADDRLSEGGRDARAALADVDSGSISLRQAITNAPILLSCSEAIQGYADRLHLVKASGATTTLDELEAMATPEVDVLIVDYIQKIPLAEDGLLERERVTRVAQGLKDLAMSRDIAVLAVAAVDVEGLTAPRLRLHHVRGSSALAYEADLVVVINEKFGIVSRSQMAYDLGSAERFKNELIFSVEKNREGTDMVDMTFGKQFDYLRVNPTGRLVTERLIDNRLFTE